MSPILATAMKLSTVTIVPDVSRPLTNNAAWIYHIGNHTCRENEATIFVHFLVSKAYPKCLWSDLSEGANT